METEKLKQLFKDSYIEINTNHNEAVKVFEKYVNAKTELKTLINFDSHSDLTQNNKLINCHIGNWVNFCIKKFNLEEFYWVLPEHITNIKEPNPYTQYKNNLYSNNFMGFEKMSINPMQNNSGYFYYVPETNEIRTQYNIDYLNQKLKKYGLKEVFKKETLKKVKVSVLQADNLEEISNKEIFLSIDADYFCNSGHDTTQYINNLNITKDELHQNFEKLVDVLIESKAKIKCCSLTYSPVYFPLKFEKEIKEFFELIKKQSEIVLTT